MDDRSKRTATRLAAVVSVALAGCGPLSLTDIVSPDLLSALGLGSQATNLPGEAPGLLVSVENRTTRWARVLVAYRDVNDKAQSFTSTVPPSGKTAQMLPCPVKEITLGDVSNLALSGAVIYLIDNVNDPNMLQNAPFLEVPPFGVLLREGVNYDCGDGLIFAVQPASDVSAGYRTFAYIRRSGQQ